MVARGEEATVFVAVIAVYNGFSSKKEMNFRLLCETAETHNFHVSTKNAKCLLEILMEFWQKREQQTGFATCSYALPAGGANINNEIGHFRRMHSNFPQHQHHSGTPFTLPGQARPVISYVIIFFQLKRIQWNNFKLMRFHVVLHTPPSNRYTHSYNVIYRFT